MYHKTFVIEQTDWITTDLLFKQPNDGEGIQVSRLGSMRILRKQDFQDLDPPQDTKL